MRVTIVTESFLPQVNGVSNSVRHVVEQLEASGHEVLVVAPGAGPARYGNTPVVRTRSVALPGYRSFPLGLPDPVVDSAITEFRPDVVHLASPIALGAVGLRAARKHGLPTVAVYQTDISGFARHYGIRAHAALSRWVAGLHRRVDRTLVPSRSAHAYLAAAGVKNLHLWRRGVALDLFGPHRRDPYLHDVWTSGQDHVVVGYVGRLAAEKKVRRLCEIASIPGTRMVIIGDGPMRGWLQRKLPRARFPGLLRGEELAEAFATLDVFVHTGEAETFCQTVQEAQASGVPVVAPAVGGPLDLVHDGVSGLLHDPAEPRTLRRSVATLVARPELRHSVAGNAYAAVTGRSWEAVVEELVNVHYTALVSGGAERAAA